MERIRIGRNIEGNGPSEARADENGRREMNLPPLLAAHLGRNEDGQPPRSSLISIHGGRQSSINTRGNLLPNGLFADPTGFVTPFVRWIEDYPLPDGLKMPSHVGSYDGNGDPDNFLHLFEGAIRMQKWLMPVACHMFTYTLKDSAQIWWNSQKAVHSIKQREGESVRAFATRYTDDTLQLLGLHEDQRISSFVHGLKARNLVEHLSTDLPSTYKIEEAARSGQLSHLVKGIKKERKKTSNSQQGEKKEKNTTPAEAPILMINREEARTRNNISKSPTFEGREITFLLVTKGSNSSAPVIIKAKIFRREVGRIHMESDNSCEVIYGHCFLKLKPYIQASKVDSQVPLVGFLGKKS
ncbi:hypothetical protein Tco_1280089 [Tanacetum coccineum]